MELVSDYMRDDTLRHALNEFTKKTMEPMITGCFISVNSLKVLRMKNFIFRSFHMREDER